MPDDFDVVQFRKDCDGMRPEMARFCARHPFWPRWRLLAKYRLMIEWRRKMTKLNDDFAHYVTVATKARRHFTIGGDNNVG